MGENYRHHTGSMVIPASILDDIDWVLDMHPAQPQAVVIAARGKHAAAVAEHGFFSEDAGEVHDYLTSYETGLVQQPRGWNRLRHGNVTVDAELHSLIRNILNDESNRRCRWRTCTRTMTVGPRVGQTSNHTRAKMGRAITFTAMVSSKLTGHRIHTTTQRTRLDHPRLVTSP